MPPSFLVGVEQPANTRPMYQLWYLVGNNIGDEGCRYLSISLWNTLQTLNLRISYSI